MPSPPEQIGRRAALGRLGGFLAALSVPGALAACGSDGEPSTVAATSSGAATSAPSGSASSSTRATATPRTISHRFGTTTIPASPTRIVTVGTTDADALAVLGIAPVGAYPNTGFGSEPFWPWVASRPELRETEPLELDAAFRAKIEQIAALRPDLILAVNDYNEPEPAYALLSEVAPTLAASADPVTMGWADHAREIADALGRRADMDVALAAVDERIAAVAAENPAFAGATMSFGGVFSPEAATIVFGEQDYSRVFLAQLGFRVPPRQLAELPALTGADPIATQAPVSLERLDLLDADVLVLAYLDPAVRTEFEARDVFRQVPVVADGRYIAATAGTVAALRIPSVLAIPYALDQLVPELRRVLPG